MRQPARRRYVVPCGMETHCRLLHSQIQREVNTPAYVRLASDYFVDVFAQQEDFSMYHRVAGGSSSGTHTRRTNSGDDNAGGDDGERLLMLSQSISPVLCADNGNGEGGLQGLSPGSGQDTYAAQFRSPYPHSHQSAVGVECSTGSVFDATSPRCRGVGVDESILSPGVDSVKTASSMWMCEGGTTAGAWKDDENKGKEYVSLEGGEDREMEDEGSSKTKDWENGEEEQRAHGVRQCDLFNEEGERAASAAPKDHARCSSSR